MNCLWHEILFEEPYPTGSRPRDPIGLYGTGILFEEPNPTGSQPRDLIGLHKQHMKPHPPEHTRKGKENVSKYREATRGDDEMMMFMFNKVICSHIKVGFIDDDPRTD